MIESYLSVLEETLDKKLQVLNEVEQLNQEQTRLLNAEELDLELFDSCVEKKGMCIEKLNKLDEGFEALYQRIALELKEHKTAYAVQIKEMQEKIQQILDKSVSIQAMESRNKEAVEKYFKGKRAGLGAERRSSKAAFDYYRNMNGTNVVPPQFLDKKK